MQVILKLKSYQHHVATLGNACSKLGDLLDAYKKTDYLVETMRVTLEGQTEKINAIADLMPVMSNDDASKIILLLANIGNVDTFITALRKNEDDYQAQQQTITEYYNKLDKDGMMVPASKKPDSRFVSEYSPMLEKLKSCKCNGIMDKIIVLVDKYRNQLDKLRDINNFSVYTKEHPGIQHKAGVPVGGTFIVVYKGPNDKSDKIPKNTVIADFYLPYNCCSNCNPVEVTFSETPPPENKPPVARPGDNISIQLPENSVTLDGSTSSDPDGTIKTYFWEQESGPQASVEKPNESITAVSGLSEGSYKFKLTVTDDDGASDSKSVSVTVLPRQNEPPVARAKANPDFLVFSAGQTITTQLDGSDSSDPDDGIKSYEWKLTSSGLTAQIDSPDKAVTGVKFTQPGNFDFQLTVTDEAGLSSSANVSVQVARETTESKTCALPGNIISDFEKIPETETSESLQAFIQKYPDFENINRFFELMKLADFVNLPVADQVKFLIKQKTEPQLQKWIRNIQSVLFEPEQFRTFSLKTFNVLTELAFFISCFQEQDIDKADVKMMNSLSMITEMLQRIVSGIDNFSPEHKKIVSELATFSKEERKRLINNGEENKKPAYAEIMRSIVYVFKSVNL